MGLSVIMLANLFLVQVNSSNSKFAFQSLKLLIKDKVMLIVNIGTFGGLFLMMYTPLHVFLKLSPLTFVQFLMAFGIAAISVMWYEMVKLVRFFTRAK